MTMEDIETRKRIFSEYKEIESQFQKLHETLLGSVSTAENAEEKKKVNDLGRKLDAKIAELTKAYGIRRLF